MIKLKIIPHVAFNMHDFEFLITIQANNLYFLLNGRLRTTEEKSGSGSINDYGRGKSVGFVEAYQVRSRNNDS